MEPRAIELESVLDITRLQPLMQDFYRLTGVPMSIIDLKGKVLVGAGWQKVCLEFHRANEESCCNCIESDLHLTERIAPGEFRLYKCKNNMWDVATPLIIGGQHAGNVFSGQFFFDDEPIDYEFFRTQARRYGYDEQQYLDALQLAPRLSRSTVQAGMAYLVKCAQFLSLLGLRNRELAQTVTERDILMRGLRESDERLRKAQAIAHVGSWELDLATDRLTWSDEVYRIFGLQPQEFKATYEAFLERIHPEDREAVNAAYMGSVREGRDSYEITHRVIRNATGEIRWVHEKCEHLRDSSGAIIRSIGMVQDITEQKQAEEQLRHKQKLESLGLLAAGVAHDFNNLLVAVIGNASLAREQLGSSHPVGEILDGIITAGQRAADLTRQMLAYAGKGRFIVQSVDLNGLVREISGIVQASFSKKIALSLSLDDNLPLIQGDPGQLQQVLMNLMINAAEAIGDNAGLVAVRTYRGNGAEARHPELRHERQR
jgi:PAS domain S-box-containing protein